MRRAHKQALANIKNPQRVASARTSRPTAKEDNAAHPAETTAKADKPAVSVEHSQDNASAQRIWNKYSPGENGVFESMAKGNPKMQQMSDQLIAKEALLAGEDPRDVRKAIAQHSPYAQSLKGPGSYASRTIGKAEQSNEVKEKRAKEKAQNARPSRKEAQQRQANQTRRSSSKTKLKKKLKAHDQGMSY